MRYDDDFVCGVALPQTLDRGHGAAGDAVDRFGWSPALRRTVRREDL